MSRCWNVETDSCDTLGASIIGASSCARVAAEQVRVGGHGLNQDLIRQSLERYGEALSTGDLAGIWSCWEVPGLVLADDGAVAMSDQRQAEGFFARALGWYQSQGLMATRPELERAVALTQRLTLVSVRWPSFDHAGVERSSERSHYILRLGDDGQHRIQVALTESLSHPD